MVSDSTKLDKLRGLIAIGFLIIVSSLQAQQFSVQTTEMALIPEAVSNNAVCEGYVGTTPYVYSFCGIDTSKDHEGIHLKSFRYNTATDVWETIASVPDTMGKVAASANRVGDIIYVMGGYHVLANGNEVSSKSVHRYDTQNNMWLTDGTNIPVPIDDQVQAVYKDSLIYVITGWSNVNNVTAVQIYDTYNDSWQVGTAVPNTSASRLFGASGIIIGNTIYYFGGAKNGSFVANNTLTIGEIDPLDPNTITWTDTILAANLYGYRNTCTSIWGEAIWLGGSDITYNYNGIAYNGSGGVPPNNKVLMLGADMVWDSTSIDLPMDLRGLAHTSLFTRYLAGGMKPNQQVSRKTIKIEFTDLTDVFEAHSKEKFVRVYPNPNNGTFGIKLQETTPNHLIILYNQLGEKIKTIKVVSELTTVDVSGLPTGIYFVQLTDQNDIVDVQKVIVY